MKRVRDWLKQIWDAVRPSRDALIEATAPFLLAVGVIWWAVLLFRRDWVGAALFVPGWALLLGLANYAPLRERLLGQTLNLRHMLHIFFYWLLSAAWLGLLRQLIITPAAGKESQFFYVVLLAFFGVTWAAVRSLLIVTVPRAYNIASTEIPLWEQVLLILNESLAIGLTAYVWASVLVRVFQPQVFTVQLNLIYGLGLGVAGLLYYVLMQFLWLERWNRWLSQNQVWLVLARVFSPYILFVMTVLIASRFTERTDPRTASLLDSGDVDLAVLAVVPVIWLLVAVMMGLSYTSGRGLKQRFLPDALLAHVPLRLRRLLEAISDMDLLLLVGVLTMFIPVYLLFFGESGGVVGQARQAILQRGSALLETPEQALAIFFILPFYLFIVTMLGLYALVISRPSISAQGRDDLMRKLPVGFFITLIITLYLFAVPFTQVFTEGRLPTLSRDLGRILAFYVFVPLLLLYLHFFVLVRFPYGRGQRLWRTRYATELDQELRRIDRRITHLNRELSRIDTKWTLSRGEDTAELRGKMNQLHHYIQLNGERDDLNMERVKIVSDRQNLAEVSDTPFSVAVARLPLRIISVGIPLLLLFQLYQWAVLNEGLQEVVNNPNITVADFIQILLDNIEF